MRARKLFVLPGLLAIVLAAILVPHVGRAAPARSARDAGTGTPAGGTLSSACPAAGWTTAASPNPGTTTNQLFGIAAISPRDIWAVGDWTTNTQAGTPLTEHWNGMQWSVVSAVQSGQGVILRGVAADAPGDVWAVGYYGPSGSTYNQTLIEHWNGTAWSIMPSPNVANAPNILFGVVALAGNDAWAVGYSAPSSTEPLILHWDGTAWRISASPALPFAGSLAAIAAVSPRDIWAVGDTTSGAGNASLIEHWDGTQWSVVTNPGTGQLNGVTARAANDVWAVGQVPGATPLAEHWNGTNWTLVSAPNKAGVSTSFTSVAAVPGTAQLWAAGDLGTESSTVIEHWNGRSWSVVASPATSAGGDQLFGIVALGPTDAWAVGSYYTPAATNSAPSSATSSSLHTAQQILAGIPPTRTLVLHYHSPPPTGRPCLG